MQESVLTALIVVFICLLCAGLIIYTVFFTIHKIYFRKEINLIKKYNELLNGLNSINIFKIQVLAKNDIGNKFDLNKCIEIHKQLQKNAAQIKNNITVAELELNAFNLKIAKKYLQNINTDLDKALNNFKEFKAAYNSYTQYGSAIQTTFQNYLEIYEYLYSFFETKLPYHDRFDKIKKLFVAIRKTFESIPSLSNKFDYKRTVDTVVDLSNKLKTLSNAIITVYRFQIVDTYLKSTKEYNDKLISNHYEEIDRSDLQSLRNLLTVFTHAYKHFSAHYQSLELGKAQMFAVQAIDALNQVNQFGYVHISTPTMINVSVNEIKEQTDKILANKDDIIKSMWELKQYFVLEPKIIDSFNLIEKNVNQIAELNNSTNRVNYSTHSEKIKAVRDLSEIGNQIVTKKEEIINSIDSINDMLAKIIKTVTDLNDFYIYFWQLLSFIKQVAPNSTESENMQELIKANLKQIDQYSKEIITSENPDFDTIAYELSSIVEQSNQIYKRVTTAYMLKAYANKLFTYANRYKTFKQLKLNFEDATKAFKAKHYDDCIDILLRIIKSAKKLKNK